MTATDRCKPIAALVWHPTQYPWPVSCGAMAPVGGRCRRHGLHGQGRDRRRRSTFNISNREVPATVGQEGALGGLHGQISRMRVQNFNVAVFIHERLRKCAGFRYHSTIH